MKKMIKNIRNEVSEWLNKNDGNVVFIATFIEFDKENEVKDDYSIAFGNKETLNIALDSLKDMVKEDKEEFISW